MIQPYFIYKDISCELYDCRDFAWKSKKHSVLSDRVKVGESRDEIDELYSAPNTFLEDDSDFVPNSLDKFIANIIPIPFVGEWAAYIVAEYEERKNVEIGQSIPKGLKKRVLKNIVTQRFNAYFLIPFGSAFVYYISTHDDFFRFIDGLF